MSLIHWWPLNGDLIDKVGGKNGTLLGEAIVTEKGKTGKCLSGMTGEQTIAGVSVANCNLVNELTSGEYSFACWFKVHGTHVHYNGAIMSSGNWNYQAWSVGVSQDNTQIDVFSDKYNRWVSLGYALTTNKWYHLASVQSKGKNSIYLDGKLIGVREAAPLFESDSTELCIGRESYARGHFSFNGDICDVRVYNHALSQKEVYDLSKALVAHYTFNDILADGTENLVYGKITGYQSEWEELGDEKHQGLPIYRNTVTYKWSEGVAARDNAGFCYTTPFEYHQDGTKQPYIQLSLWKRLHETYGQAFWGYVQVEYDDGTNQQLSWAIDNKDKAEWTTDISTYGKWEFLSLKAKIPNGKKVVKIIRLYYYSRNATGGICDFSGIQIEAKDHPTPYARGIRTPMLRNEAGYDKPLINGLELTTDTNCGQYAMVFDSSKPTYIKTPLDLVGDTDVSVAYWLYPTGGNMFAGNMLYNVMNAGKDSNHWQVSLYAYGRSNKWLDSGGDCIKKNEWNHVVVTYSENKRTLYVNGKKNCEDEISGTFESRSYGNTLDIGAESSTARVFDGRMSDIRIYRSCLTEEDVENLYLTKGSIDNQNQVGASSFVEGCENALFSNNYIFESNEIYEDIENYERLEFLESSGAQYVDTGYVATTKSFTYEVDFESKVIDAFDSFIGFMNPNNNACRAGIHYYSNTIMFGAANTINSPIPWTKNERMVLRGDFTSGAQKLYKNNTLIAQTATTTDALANNKLSTYIFARNCSNSMNYTDMKLYSAKIYEGKTLVRYYIPMRRKIDQKPGLYDLINKTFTTNGAQGEDFTYGTVLAHEQASIYTNARVSATNFVEV